MQKAEWQPSADLKALQIRAKVLSDIRSFFLERNVLEVETPLMCQSGALDPHFDLFVTHYKPGGVQEIPMYLQTSPEFAMKRLLAFGSGPIYQICHAFRNGENGRLHNPEFTMLEWYRPGFTHFDLMDEMDALLQRVLECAPAKRCTYEEVFQHYLHIDPHRISISDLKICAENHQIALEPATINTLDKDDWLNLLFTHCIESYLGQDKPLFIYDYPETQSALAKIRKGTPSVAERFEVYIKGIELANGYHELTDAKEQLTRFEKDYQTRLNMKKPTSPIDKKFIAALEHGLPECAGVALGVDRLVLLKGGYTSIHQCISFIVDNA